MQFYAIPCSCWRRSGLSPEVQRGGGCDAWRLDVGVVSDLAWISYGQTWWLVDSTNTNMDGLKYSQSKQPFPVKAVPQYPENISVPRSTTLNYEKGMVILLFLWLKQCHKPAHFWWSNNHPVLWWFGEWLRKFQPHYPLVI